MILKNQEKILVEPYGGKLVNLLAPCEEREKWHAHAANLPRVQISLRNVCDLELMAVGGFSPVQRFMGKEDYLSVLETMRLVNGTIFPLPVTLPVGKNCNLKLDGEIALADQNNNLLAVMQVEEIYPWDQRREAQLAYGTTDARHPTVAEMNAWGKINICGSLRVLSLPKHRDFTDLRLTPNETRERLLALNCENVVAFQTRNPLHRAHEELRNVCAGTKGKDQEFYGH